MSRFVSLLILFPFSVYSQPLPDDQELIRRVVNLGDSLSASNQFSGVVLLAKDGLPLLERAYGYADRDQKIPNTIETKFNVGSINKTFTRLAILMLAAKGQLSLDDPIGKFLPDYPNRNAAERVTIRHMLDMRSGIGDIFGERYDRTPKEQLSALKDFLPLFADLPLQFEPGEGRRYSNGGYIVLGLIIEKASGTDYYTFVRENIFRPAGMGNSDWYFRDAEMPDRATGYVAREGNLESNHTSLPARGSSAGGGYSTARDLLAYTVALRDGRIGSTGYGAEEGLGIAGGAPGINAVLEWNPRSGYALIVLSNFGPPAAQQIAQRVRGWLRQPD